MYNIILFFYVVFKDKTPDKMTKTLNRIEMKLIQMMNKIYNSMSMILSTATLIWGRSLCRVWVFSSLTVLLKMIFHILTSATRAIRLPWSEINFIIHSPMSFQTLMIFLTCGTNLSGLFLTAFTFIAWTKTIEQFFYGTKNSFFWMKYEKFTPKRRFGCRENGSPNSW